MMVAQQAHAALFAELEALELREREVSDFRRRLHARLDAYPNEITAQAERNVSAERKDLHRRIDSLRAMLRPEIGRREQQPPKSRLGA
jgi:hypothetical protein